MASSDEYRWDLLPRPQAPHDERPRESRPEDFGLLRVQPATFACRLCGSVVARELGARHQAWHAALDAMPPPETIHVVQGLSNAGVSDYRYFTLRSTQPPRDAIAKLRAWASKQRGDLSPTSADGFTAQLMGSTWTLDPSRPEALPTRIALTAHRDAAGSTIEALLLAGVLVGGRIGASTGALGPAYGPDPGAYEPRFDQLEKGIREQVERR